MVFKQIDKQIDHTNLLLQRKTSFKSQILPIINPKSLIILYNNQINIQKKDNNQ